MRSTAAPRPTSTDSPGRWGSSRPPFRCTSWPSATTLRNGQIGHDRQMVGGAERIRIADDLDAGNAIAKCRRHEYVVEPNVRIPGRHREARITGMGRAERID